MTRVQVEQISLAMVDETAVGVAATSGWQKLEPDNVTRFGAEVTLTARRPISVERQAEEGIVTNLEAGVGYETDLTMSSMSSFLDKFLYAQYSNWDLIFTAADVTTGGFTIPSATANQAGKVQFVTGDHATLVYSRGYANAANNGLFAITTDLAATDTTLVIAGAGLVTETAPTNARLELAGVRAATSDLAITVSGTTATLVSAADITDWSTLGLIAGQEIYVGGLTSSEQFSAGRGFARIASISGATLNLDKIDPLLATDPGTGDTVDILFGQFARNVASDADADGNRFQDTTQHFEMAYPRSGSSTIYEYTVGGHASQIAINIPLNDKPTMTVEFMATSADELTTTRKTGASSATLPVMRAAFNTGDNIANLRTSAADSGDEICFKSMTVTFNNNGSPENCLGTLGATAVNIGIFLMTVEAQAWFTGIAASNAIKNNVTVTIDWQFRNAQGGIAFDVPSMKLGGGGKEFPRDQIVLINTTGEAFKDAIFGTSIGVTLFPVLPAA